jgi:hypothetical protein
VGEFPEVLGRDVAASLCARFGSLPERLERIGNTIWLGIGVGFDGTTDPPISDVVEQEWCRLSGSAGPEPQGAAVPLHAMCLDLHGLLG